MLALTAALLAVVLRYVNLARRSGKDVIASMAKDVNILRLEDDLRESNRVLRSIQIENVGIRGDTIFPSAGNQARGGDNRQLIFVMSRLCRVCTASLPLLDSIERRSPGLVVGVTFGDDRKSIEEYSSQHGIRFPIIVAPRGELVARLPRHATPVFALRDSNYLKALDIGLTVASRAKLIQLAR